jgi:hypothetical protein
MGQLCKIRLNYKGKIYQTTIIKRNAQLGNKIQKLTHKIISCKSNYPKKININEKKVRVSG